MLGICGEKHFIIRNAYVYALFFYSFSFDLYGGHCFLVQLPSKVMRSFTHRIRLPASCNNAPQHITMFPDSWGKPERAPHKPVVTVCFTSVIYPKFYVANMESPTLGGCCTCCGSIMCNTFLQYIHGKPHM